MRKIAEATFTDYIFLFGESRSRLSDISAKSALSTGGRIYMLWENGQAVGYVCLSADSGFTRLLYGYTIETEREKGVFSALLSFAAENMPKPVRVGITEKHRYFAAVSRACLKCGFEKGSVCNVFSGKSEDFIRWEEYMADTGGKLCNMLNRQGFSKVSFADLPEKRISDIYLSGENNFRNELDVKPFFDDPNRYLSRKMSYAVFRENELAAYTLVSTPDKSSAVFEHISASERYLGSGCILLAFAGSMEMFKTFDCKRAVYAMYENNDRANKFQKKLLGIVTSSVKCSINYILH